MKQTEKQCPLCKRMLKAPGFNPHMAWHRKQGQSAPVTQVKPTEKSHLELAIAQVEFSIADIVAQLIAQRDLERQLTALHHELDALQTAQRTINQVNHVDIAQAS